MRNTNILTLNVKGLHGQASRGMLFAWILCLNIDFLCVQETHANSIQEFSSWVEDYNNRAPPHKQLCCKSSPGSTRSSGVAILFRPPLNMFEGMTVDALLLLNFLATILTSKSCVYMHRVLEMKGINFFESLYHSIDPDIPIVMCGDLMQRSILMSIALDATLYPPGQTIGPPLIDS